MRRDGGREAIRAIAHARDLAEPAVDAPELRQPEVARDQESHQVELCAHREAQCDCGDRGSGDPVCNENDEAACRDALEKLRRTCADGEKASGNLMEDVLEASRRDATLGEICRVFRDVFGEYRDPAHV